MTPNPNRWWTLGCVAIGTFMLLLDITIVNVALPDIQSELDGSLQDLQWVIDAYALSLAALLLTAGSLALLADAFRGKDRGIAFGLWGAIAGLAVAIGPLLGGGQSEVLGGMDGIGAQALPQ